MKCVNINFLLAYFLTCTYMFFVFLYKDSAVSLLSDVSAVRFGSLNLQEAVIFAVSI